MATILSVSKFPPIEGGIASRTYWLSEALAERGHVIHVVTDPVGLDKTHEIRRLSDIHCSHEFTVHRSSMEIPWHIPFDLHRTPALLNLTLELIEQLKPDLIEAGYLVPYGLVAALAAKITGLPYVLRHGGSDVNKFLAAGIWASVWRYAIEGARLILTDVIGQSEIKNWKTSKDIRVIPPYVPDPRVFKPAGRRTRKKPTLALVGKANFHWKHKGWHRAIGIWTHLTRDFNFLIVTQGVGLDTFRGFAHQRLGDMVHWKSFVPPWEMPKLLRAVDALFFFQADLPFPMFSNTLLEALSCGVTVFVDSAHVVEQYAQYGVELDGLAGSLVVLPPAKSRQLADIVRCHLGHKRDEKDPISLLAFQSYIDANERWLEAVAHRFHA